MGKQLYKLKFGIPDRSGTVLDETSDRSKCCIGYTTTKPEATHCARRQCRNPLEKWFQVEVQNAQKYTWYMPIRAIARICHRQTSGKTTRDPHDKALVTRFQKARANERDPHSQDEGDF